MRRFIGALAACLTSGSAIAGMVTLNAPASSFDANAPIQTAALARYRISNSNWDQLISTSTSVSTSTIVGTSNIATHNTLNNARWNFNFSFEPDEGYTWTLQHVSGGRVTPGTVSTVTWNAPMGNANPLTSFNAIELAAEAGPSMPNGVSSAYVSVSNLHFSVSGLDTQGALGNMLDQWAGVEADSSRQWVVSNSDLSEHAWSLSGTVVAGFAGTPMGNIDERLRFEMRTAAVTTVPAPAAITLGAMALGGLAHVRRRNRQGQ
ncbi:hypothetical protein RAS1_16520 [Phycisphaerae bacterium RAS1]|nr:hypothetical protein RAS1_16520 [Phycisphaerae bacterium RAS1]